jgi:hypothetical protein
MEISGQDHASAVILPKERATYTCLRKACLDKRTVLRPAGNVTRVVRSIAAIHFTELVKMRRVWEDDIKMDLKRVVRVWIEFVWLKIRTSGGLS